MPPTSTPSRFIAAFPGRSTILPKCSRRSIVAIASRASESGKVVYDERGDLAPPGELEAGLDLRPRVDERADHLLLPAEERDDVERDDLAGVGAADDQAAVLRQRVETLLEQLAADVLEDEVDAAAAGQPHHLRDDVLRPVVDPVIEAELGGARELLVGARVADHGRAGEPRELDGRRADAAADRVDQHGLPDAESAAREQHVPGGAERDLERGRGLVRELLRHPHQVPASSRRASRRSRPRSRS